MELFSLIVLISIKIVLFLLGYFKEIITSWPAITLLLGLYIFSKYGDTIFSILKNLNFKNGGLELTTKAQEVSKEVDNSSNLSIESEKNLQEIITEKESELQGVTQQKDYWVRESILNDFKYLNTYLVPRSKVILKSIHETSPTYEQLKKGYPALMGGMEDTEGQTELILQVLASEGLIEKNDATGCHETTPKGETFLRHIGLIT